MIALMKEHGKVKYIVMSEGTCSVPASFQALRNRVLQTCLNTFFMVYNDDPLALSLEKGIDIIKLEVVQN